MNTERVKQLIDKFYEGQTTLEEEQQLREYFQRDEIPEELQSHADYFQYAEIMSDESLSSGFDPFAKIDAQPEENVVSLDSRKGAGNRLGANNNVLTWSLRVAAGLLLLLIGFAAGQFLNGNQASTEQVAALQQEVQQMKEALVYGGNYRQASAGERLSAVKSSTRFASDQAEVDQQITDILVYTMNNDKSVNVRMAAAEALFHFRDDPHIQRALVNSLTQQENPQMQITLIDMLVQLKAKGALNEMNKLLMNSETREIVRDRLRAGIAELRT